MPFKSGKSFKDVNVGLTKFEAKVNDATGRAVYAAAITGAGLSKLMTPVKTSNLINSQFTTSSKTTTGWRAITGFTANYALAVHNKPGTLMGNPNYWQPDAEPKFLLKAFIGPNEKEVSNAFFKALKL